MSQPLLLDPSVALDPSVVGLGGDAVVVSALVEHLQSLDDWAVEREGQFLGLDQVAQYFYRDVPPMSPGSVLEQLVQQASILDEPSDIHSFARQLGGPIGEGYEVDPIARILAQQAHYLTRHSFGVARSASAFAEYKRTSLRTIELASSEKQRIRDDQPTELLHQILRVVPRFVFMFGLHSLLDVLRLDSALMEATADAIVWIRFENGQLERDDLVGNLERLARLRESGFLNNQEYSAAKRRLLGIPKRQRSSRRGSG